jgi:hypothetical protein
VSILEGNLQKRFDEYTKRLFITSAIIFLPSKKKCQFYSKLIEDHRYQMTKDNFPYIAAVLGVVLTVIVYKGSGLRDDGRTLIPLLTLLLITEFGAIVTAIGAYLGGKHIFATRKISGHTAVTILCVVLFVRFVISGFHLWPH